jgi:hypothetical protein
MAVLSLERQWRILISGEEHLIDLNLENKGIHVLFVVKINHTIQIEEKNTDLAKLWGNYLLDVDGTPFTLRLYKKGILGMATDCDLYFEENDVPIGEMFEVPHVSQRTVESTENEGPGGNVRMYPKLPTACGACGAPVHMQNVRWVGPMSAACSSCGSTIEIEWREM